MNGKHIFGVPSSGDYSYRASTGSTYVTYVPYCSGKLMECTYLVSYRDVNREVGGRLVGLHRVADISDEPISVRVVNHIQGAQTPLIKYVAVRNDTYSRDYVVRALQRLGYDSELMVNMLVERDTEWTTYRMGLYGCDSAGYAIAYKPKAFVPSEIRDDDVTAQPTVSATRSEVTGVTEPVYTSGDPSSVSSDPQPEYSPAAKHSDPTFSGMGSVDIPTHKANDQHQPERWNYYEVAMTSTASGVKADGYWVYTPDGRRRVESLNNDTVDETYTHIPNEKVKQELLDYYASQQNMSSSSTSSTSSSSSGDGGSYYFPTQKTDAVSALTQTINSTPSLFYPVSDNSGFKFP